MSVMPGAGARPPRGQREDRAGLIAWGVPWGGEGDSSPRGRDLGWGWLPPRVRALQERSRDGPGAPDIPIPHLPRPAVKARVGADPILQTSVHRGAHLLETDCARTPWVERAAARGRRTGREAGHARRLGRCATPDSGVWDRRLGGVGPQMRGCGTADLAVWDRVRGALKKT